MPKYTHTAKNVAYLYQVTTSTVNSWRRSGKIQGCRSKGRGSPYLYDLTSCSFKRPILNKTRSPIVKDSTCGNCRYWDLVGNTSVGRCILTEVFGGSVSHDTKAHSQYDGYLLSKKDFSCNQWERIFKDGKRITDVTFTQ